MAAAVAQAIHSRSPLIVEAGTGTGKTFAYLVPALLAGGRVIVSTGTRNLQDQLYRRDLPQLLAVLGLGRSTALLKGRANYVCRHHLDRNLQAADLAANVRADLVRIARFARISDSGDRSELEEVAEGAAAWAQATSTRENCLGQECPQAAECFVLRARATAQQADVVVINHHLFCADLSLRDEGVAELLPQAAAVVFDEAHQLPEVAPAFFGQSFSSRQLLDFARDLLRIGLADAPDAGRWTDIAGSLEQRLREWRLAAGSPARRDLAWLREQPEHEAALHALLITLREIDRGLQALAERSRDLLRLAMRSNLLCERLQRWMRAAFATEAQREEDSAPGEVVGSAASNDPADAADAGQPGAKSPSVLWCDIHRFGVTLYATPLSVGGILRRHREAGNAAWIHVSATLTVDGSFAHYASAAGLEDADTLRIDSPFDYAANSRLYVPRNCGLPSAEGFAERLMQACWPLLQANEGRAFVLCTSLRMVDRLSALLRQRIAAQPQAPLQLLVQGDAPRDRLVARFRSDQRPVLVGSASFWEGVDVVGPQLSMVIIDKLPFAPPDEPLLQARTAACREAGGDPFRQIQIPDAAMALKQGAGRLIRSETDRGLLVVCDERLVSKGYGRTLLRSLPPFGLLRDEAAALAWLADQRAPVAPTRN